MGLSGPVCSGFYRTPVGFFCFFAVLSCLNQVTLCPESEGEETTQKQRNILVKSFSDGSESRLENPELYSESSPLSNI